MTFKKTTLALLATTALTVSASARDQIKIVGSSTVYPFSSVVAEELGATTKYPTPVVESTGSGGGYKLFCAGNDLNTPDFTNASSRMKTKVLDTCHKNGVKNITEAVIGFDGITFAQSKRDGDLKLTKKHLLLALSAKVPSKDGKSLIANPYKNWNEIDASLPNREIVVYGPPKSSGTRAALEEMVLESQTKKMEVYNKKKVGDIRTDGAYVPSGENDNLIVSKLAKNTKAIGIFGYSFLMENSDKVEAAYIDGALPTPENIADASYPVSRSLFFYIKNDHAKDVKAMDKYVDMFMSDNMIGADGIATEIGLIPLSDDFRAKMQDYVAKRVVLTADRLKQAAITSDLK